VRPFEVGRESQVPLAEGESCGREIRDRRANDVHNLIEEFPGVAPDRRFMLGTQRICGPQNHTGYRSAMSVGRVDRDLTPFESVLLMGTCGYVVSHLAVEAEQVRCHQDGTRSGAVIEGKCLDPDLLTNALRRPRASAVASHPDRLRRGDIHASNACTPVGERGNGQEEQKSFHCAILLSGRMLDTAAGRACCEIR
jgi:hypothetical protein